jgi:nitrate/TMAO reductase-like tetraheme cytochrome c subunit
MKSFFALVLLLLVASVSWAQTSKRLEATDFKTSSNCRNCHEQIYDQWTTSMHSKAFRDPIYQVFLRRIDEERQGRLTRFCVSCHAPLATVTRSVPEKLFDGQPKPALLEEGVSCEFCHTIPGSELELKRSSLGSFVFPRTGQANTLYGRHADAKTNDHPTEPSKFLLSSELCGTCHRFGHPASGIPIQSTYEEWKNSPYAAEGKRCQDCHMPSYSGKTANDGKDRPELHAHVFKGGHTEMILKAATVQLQSNWKGGRKETLDVVASVSNVGAGHMIPTGVPGIREMWLEVSIWNGSQVAATQKRPFKFELFDREGKPAMPWDAVRFGKDTRIGPKKTRVEQFSFKLTNSNNVRVEAKVLERLVSEQAAQYAGVPTAPAMLMAEAAAAVP